MNEEEQKAIEYFKNLDISFNTLLRIELKGFENAVNTIINLIEKQQKEIEEKTTILLTGAEKVKQLEKEITELKEEYKNEQLAELKELNNYIRKDKIREKIKELESHSWRDGYMTKFDEYAMHYLKELLGE